MRPITVVLLAFFTSLATTIGTFYGVARLRPPQVQLQKRAVPQLVGLTEQDARGNLSALGFKMLVAGREDSVDTEPGRVIRQTPLAGQLLSPDEAVNVTFASSPPAVPNVVGKNVQDATRMLEQAGYAVEVGEAEASTDHAEGLVSVQLPEAGSPLPKKGKVTVRPAKAGAQADVPKLVGLSVAKAKEAAEKANFKVAVQWVDLPETTSGVVLRQAPSPGVAKEPVSEITVTVNR
jgi:beta-lactam-binding protein with PASTA domain